jgi:hypothetical protein
LLLQFVISPQELLHFKALECIPARFIRHRMYVLQQVNKLIADAIAFVDLSLPANRSQLTDNFRRLRGLIFWTTKQRLWTKAMARGRKVSSVAPCDAMFYCALT